MSFGNEFHTLTVFIVKKILIPNFARYSLKVFPLVWCIVDKDI